MIWESLLCSLSCYTTGLGDNQDPVFASSSYCYRSDAHQSGGGGRGLLKVCWAGWAGTERSLGLSRLLDSRSLCDNSSHPVVPPSLQKDLTLILSFDPHLSSKVLQERT